MRVAIFSDVHANLPALEAVLVGSAGKPKDGDPRACWALIDTKDGSVEFRRVDHDVESAARAVEESDLPSEFADELRHARGYRAPVEA
jgi:diadenosine tetraphosphatase ApaH/serine/threonine PP2A family protein phosphatase